MIKTYNPNYKSRVEKFLERQFFMKHIHFSLSEIGEGSTEGWLPLEEVHLQQKGVVHGGVIATLADSTMGFAAYTLLADDQHVVTGELKVSYLNPGIGDRLWVKGWVLKQGKKVNFCESEVYAYNGEERKLIAKASATMITIFPEK
ncbi:PaaI family thioesterase [Fulvivirga sediminis]|uniref:Medium/long-chain acyl-CoA thioesterase YigI n=1 Tax=Fulvivirga sediminis TaxID=2803949 RepID=A0A937F7T8_9BACT|nr:PaaI family thioesterase [Fulvivirga sediminis]MBL3656204.1 PaaI family thioesterase [Fulvivirga sediminis]